MAVDRTLAGVILILAFCATAPVMDVSAKLASATIPVGQITLARFAVQGMVMVPIMLALGLDWRVPRGAWGLIALRAVFLILSAYTFFAAVAVMPVADALAIAFVQPVILMILGWLIFGEKVGPRRTIASAVGFGGALLVIQPSLLSFGLVAVLPLATAVFFAFYMVVTRQLAGGVHPVAMQMHTSVIGTAMCLIAMAGLHLAGVPGFGMVMPQGAGWVWLLGVGAVGAVSHLFMTYALKFAPSATLAPLQYFEIVSAVALGYLVFSDFPNALTGAGIAVIVASGLYIIRRERIAARRLADASRAPAPEVPRRAGRAAE